MWAGHGCFMGQKWPTGRRFATYAVENVFVLHRFAATQTVGPSPGQVAVLDGQDVSEFTAAQTPVRDNIFFFPPVSETHTVLRGV